MEYPQHFSFKELTTTNTGLPNTPVSWSQVENLRHLGSFLDDIRAKFGKPIRVNCAYRSEAVNKAVGGVSTSAHIDGRAADICAFSGLESDNRLLLKVLESELKSIDQLISYHRTSGNASTAIRFIHVGLSATDTKTGSMVTPRAQRLYK